jgi:uncharacterized membrane protein YcaP (DUF421 family)
MGDQIFFNGWSGLGRTLVVGVMAYAVLIFMLRISGKRTLSKLNAFDLVVTVALGSKLATILLSKDVALAEGAMAFLVLVGLQYILALIASRSGDVSDRVRQLIKSEPMLLVYRGEFLNDALKDERLAQVEVLAALRGQGHGSLESVEAVVLETDGTLSVITRAGSGGNDALRNVKGYPP